ncbi:zinc finger protein [Rutstroemia sp. NJR-2017a WRK4]|nr:zinc finger protein [Rutstroemia sp. NJR-2017a WRK4]
MFKRSTQTANNAEKDLSIQQCCKSINKLQNIAIAFNATYTSRIFKSSLLMYDLLHIRLYLTAVIVLESMPIKIRCVTIAVPAMQALKAEKAKDLPHKCVECDQAFQQKRQLKKHVSSNHNHIQCPVGKKCKKFATPSALLSHLESGRCSSGLTRTKMHELVFAHDSNRYITSVEAADTIHSANNIPGNAPSPLPPVADDDSLSEWSEVGGAILTPTTSESDWSLIGRNVLTPTHSDNASQWSTISEDLVHISSNTFPFATNLETSSHSAQSQGLRCHLCRPYRKPFGNIKAYQAHMSSAAHAPKIFHCPLSFMPQVNPEGPAKVKYFSTLAGLTQHMESGRCEGGLEVYGKAISFVEEQLKLLGFSDFRLLKN